jgi:hypothetical protein
MKRELRKEARRLRKQGMSVRGISKVLNISLSSASTWVRDIVLTDTQVEALKANQRRYGAQNAGANTNRVKARKMRLAFQEKGREKAREKRPLHLAGCMLYWAEGGKLRNRLYFVNSDPNMQLLFMRFLREEMGIKDSEIVVYIHCHTHDRQEIDRIRNYWVDLLELPTTCLRKTYIKKGSEIRRNTLKNGVCGIGVYKTEIIQHIYGAIQEYGGFDNPEWLF